MILHEYKIVFGGAMGAGKTAAIQALSDIPVLSTEALNTDVTSHEKMLTTVGIDYGEITLDDGVKVGLYGTPGQDRFDFMWSIISKGAIGAIILIDHSNDNPLQALEFYENAFKEYTDNIAIGITHIDAMPERPTTMYREWLDKIGKNYPLFYVDAREDKDVLLLVDTLVTSLEVTLQNG
ncbi:MULTISPECIES: ATP/GTP-binding protein [unclassified Acinetobacter]|uniref:GTP-binding protein n=1 Tax=unclassified Acinetobacter TaxID=196816 RepID=UPI0035B96944